MSDGTSAGASFQLTTSRRGRPGASGTKPENLGLSTHDLTQRSTRICRNDCPGPNLSTHDLTQRSTIMELIWMGLQIFQLTTSRRGRQAPISSIVSSTVFQLTTSRRGRRCRRTTFYWLHPFNSRPHAEVD